MKDIVWLDLGLAGVDIKVVVDTGAPEASNKSVAIRSTTPLPDDVVEALARIGFTVDVSGRRYVRQGPRFTYREMEQVFPGVSRVTLPFRDTREFTRPSRPAVPMLRRIGVPPAARPSAPPPGRDEPAPAEAPPAETAAPVAGTTGQEAPAPSPVRRPVLPRPGIPRPAPRQEPPREERKVLQPVRSEEWSGERVNRFQLKYRPASRVGTPVATIPVNLASATESALARVVSEYGDIDEFVAGRLKWTVEEMAGYLSPEQVDAVALAIAGADRGQGFVLADQTGLGKGRVVAAIARAIMVSGKVAIVITEKENLFSDLFRDIIDIGSLDLFGRPFMLNADAEIVSTSSAERQVIHAAWDKKTVAEAVRSGRLPDGCKIMLATYSQFNKRGSPKAEFLSKVAAGAEMVCDESHNAVGDSATSEVLAAAMDIADSVTFSSATFAKNAQNLSAYKRLFPVSMRSSDLMSVLASGGQAMSEALAQMLAEDGAYLRREHDLSGIKIEVLDDSERLPRNRAYADALHPILAKVAKISRAVSEVADEKNQGLGHAAGAGNGSQQGKKAGKEFWYAGNFGSRLGVIVRQFITAMLVDFCVERSVRSLLDGVKPVVVIESTMESLMRELAGEGQADTEVALDEDGQPVVSTPTAEDEAAVVEGVKPPDFRDALRLLVDRTMQLSVKRPGADEPERIPVDDPDLVALADEVRAMIAGFPDLPLSPIDDVRERIEAEGRRLFEAGAIERPWVADEISARGMRVVDGSYVKTPPIDRNGAVSGFNSGRSDALVLTTAASTGLSLHSSEKVKDRRPRRMIELQIIANPTQRVQMWGRVNRRGQVNLPFFDALSTALPLQTRQLAIQNRKVADLSANVTASAESASAMDVPDMIDAVGNAVCKRILEEKPSLADRMFIPLKLQDMEKAEGELYHVNKFLQRLVLLSSEEQEALYNEALAAYEDAVRDMAARGQHPRGARELEGEWRVVDREVFEAGDSRDGPVFGRPVTVTTIESRKMLQPWTGERVLAAVDESFRRLLAVRGATDADLFGPQVKAIMDNRTNVLQAALSRYHISIKQALQDQKPNAVKEADNRITRLVMLLKSLRPGLAIEIVGEDGREIGVVTDVRPPRDLKDSHLPGRWSIRYVVPGDESPREISAASIIRDSQASVQAYPGNVIPKAKLDQYDRAPRGLVPVRRKILDGNLVRAVIAARHAGWGSAVTWTDDNGLPHRAIMVPKSKQDSLHTLPGRVTSPDIAVSLLEAGADLWTNPDDSEGGAEIRMSGDQVHVTVPGSKRLAKAFETDAILAVAGRFSGDHRSKQASIPRHRAAELCRALAAGGHAFHFMGRFRALVSDLVPLEAPEQEERVPAMQP